MFQTVPACNDVRTCAQTCPFQYATNFRSQAPSRIDIETGTRTAISLQQVGAEGAVATTASWVHLPARKSSKRSLYSIALSSDGGLLAAAGGGRNISILDPRTNTAIRRFRGHKDAVTGLAWQSGSARLVSVSLDKSVRVWQAGDGVAED